MYEYAFDPFDDPLYCPPQELDDDDYDPTGAKAWQEHLERDCLGGVMAVLNGGY